MGYIIVDESKYLMKIIELRDRNEAALRMCTEGETRPHSERSQRFSCPSARHMQDPRTRRALSEHEKNTFKDSVPASPSATRPRPSTEEAQVTKGTCGLSVSTNTALLSAISPFKHQ